MADLGYQTTGIGGHAIHVSGFDEENLYYLKRLVKALGKLGETCEGLARLLIMDMCHLRRSIRSRLFEDQDYGSRIRPQARAQGQQSRRVEPPDRQRRLALLYGSVWAARALERVYY